MRVRRNQEMRLELRAMLAPACVPAEHAPRTAPSGIAAVMPSSGQINFERRLLPQERQAGRLGIDYSSSVDLSCPKILHCLVCVVKTVPHHNLWIYCSAFCKFDKLKHVRIASGVCPLNCNGL